MSVLFDLSALQSSDATGFHGGGEYARRVFRALTATNASRRTELFGAFSSWYPLSAEVRELADHGNCRLIPIEHRRDLPDVLSRYAIRRFYSPLPYKLKDTSLPIDEAVFTIHGLRQIEVPFDRHEWRYYASKRERLRFVKRRLRLREYLKERIRQFRDLLFTTPYSTLVVPSVHTKYALLNVFPELSAARIMVLYSPASTTQPADPQLLDSFGVQNEQFALVVSADRWIKNSYRLVHALDALYTRHESLTFRTLVLGAPEHNVFGALSRPDRFIFAPYVEPQTLHLLYKSAAFLLYPSLNEGFGYPPLEAMQYGTPVAASAVAAIPEICGNGALYFNPYDEREMQNRILQLATEARLGLSERGKERASYIRGKQDSMLGRLVDLLLEGFRKESV